TFERSLVQLRDHERVLRNVVLAPKCVSARRLESEARIVFRMPEDDDRVTAEVLATRQPVPHERGADADTLLRRHHRHRTEPHDVQPRPPQHRDRREENVSDDLAAELRHERNQRQALARNASTKSASADLPNAASLTARTAGISDSVSRRMCISRRCVVPASPSGMRPTRSVYRGSTDSVNALHDVLVLPEPRQCESADRPESSLEHTRPRSARTVEPAYDGPPFWNCVSDKLLPSGSLNQATFASEGDVQIPRASWRICSKRRNVTPRACSSSTLASMSSTSQPSTV